MTFREDSDSAAKSDKAIALLRQLETKPSVLLWQVVCESGAVMHKARFHGRVDVDAERAIDAWSQIYTLVTPSRVALRTGWRLARDLKMSYWDAMLIGACVEAGVTTLYTEDMQGSGVIDGVTPVNPFV